MKIHTECYVIRVLVVSYLSFSPGKVNRERRKNRKAYLLYYVMRLVYNLHFQVQLMNKINEMKKKQNLLCHTSRSQRS